MDDVRRLNSAVPYYLTYLLAALPRWTVDDGRAMSIFDTKGALRGQPGTLLSDWLSFGELADRHLDKLQLTRRRGRWGRRPMGSCTSRGKGKLRTDRGAWSWRVLTADGGLLTAGPWA